jgi:hypothetical protein
MEQQCQSILERVLNIAPVLSARICPIGCDDKTLSSLCVSEKQAEELQLELAKYSSKTHCTLCKKGSHFYLRFVATKINLLTSSSESQSTEPRTFWKIDFKKSTYQLTGLHFCCGLCCKLQFFSETVNNPVRSQIVSHRIPIERKAYDTHVF